MRKMIIAASLAAGVGLFWCQDAGAVPANGVVVREAATGASVMLQVEYTERRARHGVVKCYRDLVIGPYRCHHYSGPF